MDKKEIGSRIQSSRRVRGYKQESFAEALDLSTSFIAAMERGEKMPSAETLIKVAETLDVSADWLLGIRREERELKYLRLLDEEIRGIAISAQSRIVSVVKTMVEYEKVLENCQAGTKNGDDRCPS